MIRYIIIICTAIYVYSFININHIKIINNKNPKPKPKPKVKIVKDSHKKLPANFLKTESDIFNEYIKNNVNKKK